VLYDNFEGKTMDPDKWFGGQGTDTGMVTLETSRLMKNETLLKSKALSLSNRSYANTDSDIDHSTSSTRIFFADGSAIKTIEATVLVKKIQVPGAERMAMRPTYGPGSAFQYRHAHPGDSNNDVWGKSRQPT
jgi:hypothetical protein